MDWLLYILIAVVGYALGNFSSGTVVSKLFGLRDDIRNHGSGNPGTTNVMRTLGFVPALITFLGDVFKAVLSALIGLWLKGEIGGIVGGLCCVIGHNWPVFMGFKGGKGMAASFGATLVLAPKVALVIFFTQLIVLFATRYMSVASLSSAVLLPVLVWLLYRGDWPLFAFGAVLGLLAVYCHRSNIKRLKEGKENKLDFGHLPHSKMK